MADPLKNLDKNTPKNENQQLNDLHDHLVRLQKQVSSLESTVLSLQESIPDPGSMVLGESLVSNFESKVWETVMVGALTAALGPNKVLQDTPKAMQQMIERALRLADSGVEAARAYQQAQDQMRKDKEVVKNNDPLRQLIS